MTVNMKNHRLTPGDLRAYLGRHGITRTQIARRRGVSRQAVSAALFADLHERPVSPALLKEILDLANQILFERELTDGRPGTLQFVPLPQHRVAAAANSGRERPHS